MTVDELQLTDEIRFFYLNEPVMYLQCTGIKDKKHQL